MVKNNGVGRGIELIRIAYDLHLINNVARQCYELVLSLRFSKIKFCIVGICERDLDFKKKYISISREFVQFWSVSR